MRINKKVYIIAILAVLAFIGIFTFRYIKNTHSNKYNDNWYLTTMNLEKLNNYSTGKSQCIAFIDSGLEDELLNYYDTRIIYKYNVLDKSDDVSDENGHGTEMVSVACNDGYKGVYGIAPDSKIIIIKIVDSEGKTENNDLCEAIKIAIDNGATIINISLGGDIENDKVSNEIQIAIEQGITVVAAAGDYGDKDLLFPARCGDVISVQGLSNDFNLWKYSNNSLKSVLTFPCTDIKVLGIENSKIVSYKTEGTSQATALASAYIALIKDFYKSNNLNLDNKKLEKILSEIDSYKKSTGEYTKVFKQTK